MIEGFIPSPKLASGQRAGQSVFYPYYAGFSVAFAREMLTRLTSVKPGLVFDPWNGAGTTTAACAELGLSAHGCDLNPAMVVVAKGRLVASRTRPSIGPLAQRIVSTAGTALLPVEASDPLTCWLSPETAAAVRCLEATTYATLVDADAASRARTEIIDRLLEGSDLACFFYVGVFHVVRSLLAPMRASNPTWIRRPKTEAEKINVSPRVVNDAFIAAMRALGASIIEASTPVRDELQHITISMDNSAHVTLPDASVASVLTSPPYCTRIDYAVATAGELAVLGIGEQGFADLRAALMGTSTVPADVEQSLLWGPTCIELLDRVYNHPSVASRTYYYKSHCQYFNALFASMGQLARVLETRGHCALVVQNSHYKEVLNDLPQICIDMAENHGLAFVGNRSFEVRNSFSKLNRNTRSRSRRGQRELEEVILFQKLSGTTRNGNEHHHDQLYDCSACRSV